MSAKPLEGARLDLLRALAFMNDMRFKQGAMFPKWTPLSVVALDLKANGWTWDDLVLAQREAAALHQIESVAHAGPVGGIDYGMRITPGGHHFIRSRDAEAAAPTTQPGGAA